MKIKEKEIQDIVTKLNLKPLWNGDYLAKFYESDVKVSKNTLGKDFDGDRNLNSQAYYLLPEGIICPLHMMYSDESWEYCLGGPMELFILSENKLEKVTIGNKIFDEQKLVHIIPKGHWFAARCQKGWEYSLIKHFVSPSFRDLDWEKGYYDDLKKVFPENDQFLKEFSWTKS